LTLACLPLDAGLPSFAAHDLGVYLLQPLKFGDPFRQAHAVYGRHVDGLVEPVRSLAGFKVEVTDDAFARRAVYPRLASSSVTAFNVTRIPNTIPKVIAHESVLG
jgi:hypothetical protein